MIGDLERTTIVGPLVADDVMARGHAAMVFRHGWSPLQSYKPGDVVLHGGQAYICVREAASAINPARDGAHWDNLPLSGAGGGLFNTARYTAAVLADNPIAYFPLDVGPGDISTYHRSTGTSGGVSFGTTDGFPCAVFDGTSGTILINDNTALPTSGSYSMEAWIKMAGEGFGGFAAIICYGNSALNRLNGLLVHFTTNPYINWWADDFEVNVGNLVGAWHHVACTYNGTSRQLYLDGLLIGAQNRSTLNAVQTNFALGTRIAGADHLYFYGKMAHAALYGTALSGARIAAHYAAV